MMTDPHLTKNIEKFFSSEAYAVVGASVDRQKYGNKVLRCYQQHEKLVWPIHPIQISIEGIPAFHHISELPEKVKSISIITPPHITEQIVNEAHKHGIQHIWMQPGAESSKAIQMCEKYHINCIANGPCILVVLGFDEMN